MGIFKDLGDWIALALHTSIIGLHTFEVRHLTPMSLGMFIAISYMSLSSLEAIHLRKQIKEHRKDFNK